MLLDDGVALPFDTVAVPGDVRLLRWGQRVKSWSWTRPSSGSPRCASSDPLRRWDGWSPAQSVAGLCERPGRLVGVDVVGVGEAIATSSSPSSKLPAGVVVDLERRA
ncbi:MAG: hypothetical protein WKF83_11715 [Nocardioidaceae bacterium]